MKPRHPHPDDADPRPEVPLPKFVFDEPRTTFELDDGHLWIALRMHPPARRGHTSRPVAARILLYPNGSVWLDGAGTAAISQAIGEHDLEPDRYAELALLEAAKVARAVVHDRAPHLVAALGLHTHPLPDQHGWPPRTADELAQLAQLHLRIQPHYHVDEADDSLTVAVDDLLLLQPDSSPSDPRPRWSWSVLTPDGELENEGGELDTLDDLLFQVDRWVGAFEGPYALTKPVGTRVEDKNTGNTGRIVSYVRPVGRLGRRSYGIRWDDGRGGSGWFDRDLVPARRPRS